jgi:hypothetical protein
MWFYALAFVVATAFPLVVLRDLILDGTVLKHLMAEAFAGPIPTILSADLILCVALFLVFAALELRRLGKPMVWMLAYAGLCCIATSSALAFFLWQRSRWLASEGPAQQPQ